MNILTERETLSCALKGMSLARLGDGELRLAIGRGCSSQAAHPRLRRDMERVLAEPSNALVCIPRIEATPKQDFWRKYDTPEYHALYKLPTYGSSFITRPDNAEIDRPGYWWDVRRLWLDKDVTLVTGGKKDVRSYLEKDAASVRQVIGPEVNAYAEIERIERAVGDPKGPVILCLGATATILAWRLARRGVQALDLGHIGMFMRRLGVQA